MAYAYDIINWLKSKYELSSTETTPRQFVFYDKNKRLRVVFDASGYVSYTDLAQTPFIPATQSVTYSLNSEFKVHTRSVKKPNNVPSYYNLRVPTFDR